jgi:hypothetical protein
MPRQVHEMTTKQERQPSGDNARLFVYLKSQTSSEDEYCSRKNIFLYKIKLKFLTWHL